MYHIPSHDFLGCSSVNTGNMTGGRVVKIVLSSFNMIRNAGVVVGEGVTLFFKMILLVASKHFGFL